jgi:hypothetical protein
MREGGQRHGHLRDQQLHEDQKQEEQLRVDAGGGGLALTFHGCKLGVKACTTEGAEAGEIVTELLEGEYVKQPNGKAKAGLLLSPVSGHAGAFTSFACGDERFAVSGSLMTSVTANKMKTGELGLEDRAKEQVQFPKSYVNAEGTTVEAFLTAQFLGEPLDEAEPMPIEVFGHQISEEPLEVNTVL